MIFEMNEFLIVAGLVALYWAANELGFRLGRMRKSGVPDADRSHISSLQASLLGMLALLLGFSFAMAVSRFDTRKALLMREVNAIGTTYLRADFLDMEQARETKRLLRDYVDARLVSADRNISAADLEQYYRSAISIHKKLWPIASEAAARNPESEPVGLYIASLNEVIDVAEMRRGAFTNHVPEAIVALLILVSCGAMGFIGYGNGVVGRRLLPSTITYIGLSALVLVMILDLDRPRQGMILVKQDAMFRLQASLAEDAP